MNIQSIAKKVEAALKKLEDMNTRNNYFIFWKGKEESPVPDKSLVIILTEYPPEEPDSHTEELST